VNLLFLCSRNRRRSPTAEQHFANFPGVSTLSAGLSPDAEYRVGGEDLEWADLILVMERGHEKKLKREFPRETRQKKIVCLRIPDEYIFMQPELIALLEERVKAYLPPELCRV